MIKPFTRANGFIQPLQLVYFIMGWIYLAEGLAQILSLGFYSPLWNIDFAIWNMTKSGNYRDS